jgi:hypothetical protein
LAGQDNAINIDHEEKEPDEIEDDPLLATPPLSDSFESFIMHSKKDEEVDIVTGSTSILPPTI